MRLRCPSTERSFTGIHNLHLPNQAEDSTLGAWALGNSLSLCSLLDQMGLGKGGGPGSQCPPLSLAPHPHPPVHPSHHTKCSETLLHTMRTLSET